jgi:glutamyl-tRNA reductase
LIKENLSRHIGIVDSADLVVIGTSHHELPLEERQGLHISEAQQQHIAAMLRQIWGLHEFMIFNTCNRIELIAVKADDEVLEDLLCKLMGFDALAPEQMYTKTGQDAFEHVALVAAGALSQSPGEYHIVSQLKQALTTATQYGGTGGMLAQWIGAALFLSKTIRNYTSEQTQTAEIEDGVIAYLQHNGITQTTKTLVIGTGTVGQGIAQRLAALQIPFDWIYHHNKPSNVPAEANLQPFDALPEHLDTATYVISAVTTDTPIITNAHQNHFAGRNVCLIDMSAPRSIACNPPTDNMQTLDLDSLKTWQAQQSGADQAYLQKSLEVIRQHLHLYDQIMRSFEKDPQ